MITTVCRTLLFLVCMIAVSTTTHAKDAVNLETDDQKLSYGLGFQAGSSFVNNKDMKLDVDVFLRGVSDRLKDQTPAMSDDEMKNAISSFQQRVMAQQEEQTKALAAKNKIDTEAFLKANKVKKGIVTLPSGLQYEELKPGTGSTPKDDDAVVAHYRATLIDGKEFASTYTKNEPAKFSPKVVIPGWREALLHMKEGAKWRLFIPPDLAYGEKGAPPVLAPNIVTIFEVELLSVKEKENNGDDAKGADTSKPTTDKKSAQKTKKP